MMVSPTHKIFLVVLCGLWTGCGESSGRSTPPPGNALPKATFSLGDWCQGNLRTEEQRTLDALIRSVGAETCTDFEYRYESMSRKNISIPYEELVDPAPLLALTDLESLSVRGNRFTNISWTKSFESLTMLDASENPLGQETTVLNTATLAANITELVLDRTGIKELIFQEDPQITKLSLAGNAIDSLDFLINLVSLISLHIDENLVTDVSALSQLSKLENLSLAGNPLTSVAPLVNLSRLKELNLAHVELDIVMSPDVLPSQLEKITLLLRSPGGKKIDVSPVAAFTKLRVLDASGRTLTGVLEQNSALTELILEHSVIDDFEVLRKFSNLQALNINHTGMITLPNLTKSEKLTTLHAEGNALTFVDGRRLPTALRVLSLDNCNITEIRASSKLENLYELSLKGNNIVQLSDFVWPRRLRVLNLSENSIARLPDLAALSGLTSLNLGRNQIKNVSPIADLVELEQLDLSHNQVELVAPLAPLTKLTLLDVRSNGLASTTICPLVNANSCLF